MEPTYVKACRTAARGWSSALKSIPMLAVLACIGSSLIGADRSGKAYGKENELSTPLNPPTFENRNQVFLKNAATLTDQSRSDAYNDFIRVLWVNHGTSIRSLTLGKRAFFTASSFIKPPVTVDALLNYVGNYYREDKDFVVMRCKPSAEQREKVQPILATWPNNFAGPTRECLSPDLSLGERQICSLALQYQDPQRTIYTLGLAQTLLLGSQMFATAQSREALSQDYGIFPAHTGLGFVVQASAASNGDTVPMTTDETLRNSIVPEYLLKNAELAEAGCRCLQVPENQKLHQALVDPAWIWHHGKLENGACRKVADLT